MARNQKVSVRKTLRKLLSPPVVNEMARKSGAFVRVRRITPYAFAWSLILGFGAGPSRGIAGIRRVFKRVSGQDVEESSFYDRFTPELVVMLRGLIDTVLCGTWGAGRAAEGRLRRFRDIMAVDSTICRLHQMLARVWPGPRTNHSPAALKAHLLMNVTGTGKQHVRLTAGKVHDRKAFRLGDWVKGHLLLLDLGYFDYRLFARIDHLGGYFITRVKKSSSLLVVDSHINHRGQAIPVVGQWLSDVAGSLKRQLLDVQVAVRVRLRVYAGVRRSEERHFRVVGVHDETSKQYHLYLTNIPPSLLAPSDVARTYALRWETEKVFRELKNLYRLDQLPSRKPHIVEALVLASLLGVAASRALRTAIEHGYRTRPLPSQRWSLLLGAVAHDLLTCILGPQARAIRTERELLRLLVDEGPDPNVGRASLLEAVETGTHQYDPRPRRGFQQNSYRLAA